MHWRRYPWIALVPILVTQVANGVLVNQTIDDNLGDSLTGFKVQYAPLTAPDGGLVWKSQDECDDCAIKPDRASTNNNTWTSATYFGSLGNVTAALRFQGTAIYIYLVLSNYPVSTGLISAVHCDFRLDGQVVGSFSHPSDESYKFQYNTLAFARTGLTNASHTFTDVAMPLNTTSSAKPGPTSATSAPVGAIVGGVIGGVVVIALAVLGILLCRRRRKRERIHLDDPILAGPPLHSGHGAPFMSEQQADLERQLADKRRMMEALQRQSATPQFPGGLRPRKSPIAPADGGAPGAMRRVESQQRLSSQVTRVGGGSSVTGSSSVPTRVVTNQSANAEAEET
ncbi:hypothetical protein BD779DRAFT_1560519 [Infundibulicybe gibba]|nr:hypothetical protein BD779DRAFT_1560519 [Infundibulicybe gibba]